MTTLFCVHVATDNQVVAQVYKLLVGSEVNLWLDHLHTIGSDADQDEQINNALRNCVGGLFILSNSSVNDSECMAQLQALTSLNKRLYVMIWENIPADEMPEWLNAYPWIDLTQSIDSGVLELLFLIKGRPYYPQNQTETRFKLHNISGDFPRNQLDLPILGRQQDIETVHEALSNGYRGVVLLGFAGVGKTRLAAEIAATQAFKDGVVWYTFNMYSTVSDLAETIRTHLDLDERAADNDLWPLLRKYDLLIVLDSADECPQFRQFADQINRLYISRGTQVLITSRQMWADLREVRTIELRAPSSATAIEILKQMAQAQPPMNPIEGYEEKIVRAALQRPKLLAYALRWANYYPLDYVVELLQTFKGLDAHDAQEDLINKTLKVARRQDEWTKVEAALKRLAIFKKGFTFDAARAVLNPDVSPIAMLRSWGILTQLGRRYEIDPLIMRTIDVDPGSADAHFEFYKTTVADLSDKQDYGRFIAEIENIDVAFQHALATDDLEGAMELATAAMPVLGTWARHDIRKQWLDKLVTVFGENSRHPLWGELQIMIGIYFQERPSAERRNSLQRSLAYFERASRRYTQKTAPLHYGLIQNNLGITYRLFAESSHAPENLNLAIHAFNQALKVFDAASNPIEFSVLQNNLGNAFLQLANLKDPTDNLWRALSNFRRALAYLKAEEYPVLYAQVNHNLGTVYAKLSESNDRAGNLEKSIRYFARALQLNTQQTAPLDFARSSYSVALVNRALAELENPERHLNQAIQAAKGALKYWTVKTAPQQHAAAQMILGNSWLDLSEFEYDPDQLDQAADAFQSALALYSTRNNPNEYVKCLILVGFVYRKLGKLADATICWQRAERFFRSLGMVEMATQMRQLLNLGGRTALPGEYPPASHRT